MIPPKIKFSAGDFPIFRSPGAERNLADAVLEFHGIRRNNPEIKDFLENQCWYPAEPRPIDPGLKKRLLGE